MKTQDQSMTSISNSLLLPKLPRTGTGTDDGRPSNAGIFVGGFVLGGLIVGTLSCVYAPQKTRKILSEKIAQLNSAIDDVSAQLRSEDEPNETVVNSEETEAAV